MRTHALFAVTLLSLCSCLLSGCRRDRGETGAKPDSAAPAAPVEMPAGAPPAAPAAQGGATRATHDEAYVQEMTQTLNDFLADYIREKKRVPKDINEMVSLKIITSIPVLPSGKKWIINQQTGKISAQ